MTTISASRRRWKNTSCCRRSRFYAILSMKPKWPKKLNLVRLNHLVAKPGHGKAETNNKLYKYCIYTFCKVFNFFKVYLTKGLFLRVLLKVIPPSYMVGICKKNEEHKLKCLNLNRFLMQNVWKDVPLVEKQ